MKAHFTLMADYNAWANERVYRLANRLPDEQYRRDVGAYFKSLHGTLNHLLTADRIWLWRMTGTGEHPQSLDAIVYDDLPALTIARRAEDERLIALVKTFDERQFDETLSYRNLRGVPQENTRREILAHLFNHQTHHRGQVHTILTVLGVAEPDPLDVLVMLRERCSP